ncbi:cytochrome c biogenesis protein CcsA [Mucisphaera calidilacus]|uniref:Cytochrome c biogenesis protein CcsA n=1 Tax=Mucisphaera calidilacus TaxID=2527982 RepID=A0A518BZ77_9BACT|nr:cytochrome c biogenesis protein CcsA [Mucisphaera calidilacus]QDU72277.1 Cytochrome c biogenesis protein CcsA [Mucisphaera calidilacus]
MSLGVIAVIVAFLAFLAGVTWVLELRLALGRESARVVVDVLGWVTVLLTGVVALVRWLGGPDWQPFHSHLDALLLMVVLLGAALVYLQMQARSRRVGLIGWPVVSFLLAWAVCASLWTYRPFRLDTMEPVWHAVHLAGVYVGTLFAVLAAIGGVLYLLVYRGLKQHTVTGPRWGLPSLAWTESAVVWMTTLGFVMLSVGLVSGVVIVTAEPGRLGEDWWWSPKVLLAAGAWLAFAVAMNVRRLSLLRGSRAAWLAIVGLLLLIVVHGLVTAWPEPEAGMGVTEEVVP